MDMVVLPEEYSFISQPRHLQHPIMTCSALHQEAVIQLGACSQLRGWVCKPGLAAAMTSSPPNIHLLLLQL